MGNPARWLGLCLLVFGCQDLEVEKERGEPCTRTEQCVTGLVCLAGVCLESSDGGAAGAGGSAGVGGAAFEEASVEAELRETP